MGKSTDTGEDKKLAHEDSKLGLTLLFRSKGDMCSVEKEKKEESVDDLLAADEEEEEKACISMDPRPELGLIANDCERTSGSKDEKSRDGERAIDEAEGEEADAAEDKSPITSSFAHAH